MSEELYRKLARHLDNLPGGYPATESGVELRILKRLFSTDEAELALHLNIISEDAVTIGFRAGIPSAAVSEMLEAMAAKGLVIRSRDNGKPPKYMVAQFVVGIWEFQVNRLDEALVRDMDEYIPHLFSADTWKKSPQMRTIPVGRSIDSSLSVMTYENAEALVSKKDRFVISECICRKERAIHGDACDRPLETCISFGGDEDYYLHNGIGRKAGLDEVLDILRKADRAGLVLQPSNDREASWICCCCGCCCGVLRTLKKYPNPSEIAATPFMAVFDTEKCTSCGVCLRRCSMDAFRMVDGAVEYDPLRCIGCGLCVSTCPAGALKLERKPDHRQPETPYNIAFSYLIQGWKQGKTGPVDLGKMVARSVIDRFRASRREAR